MCAVGIRTRESVWMPESGYAGSSAVESGKVERLAEDTDMILRSRVGFEPSLTIGYLNGSTKMLTGQRFNPRMPESRFRPSRLLSVSRSLTPLTFARASAAPIRGIGRRLSNSLASRLMSEIQFGNAQCEEVTISR